jgi:2-polyprenyl-3-methyl-5-hydroxy-6-metoxy-1,4-benzoquinol methylase
MQITNPQPRGAAMNAYYENAQYYSHEVKSTLRQLLRQKKDAWQLRGPLAKLRAKWEAHTDCERFAMRFATDFFTFERGMDLLDYGCGNGEFLRLVRFLGLTAVGVEPDTKARRCAVKGAIPVAASLEDLRRSESVRDLDAGAVYPVAYDRIVLKHVLEHLPDPLGTLLDLAASLKPGGKMLIGVPNADAFQAEVFSDAWIGYDMPRHLWHFNPDTLRLMIKKAGYSILHLRTVELHSFALASQQHQIKLGRSPIIYGPKNIRALELQGRGAEVVAIVTKP